MGELFFSERLEARLSLLRRSALTVVEAPAGYGKTTALHRALQSVGRDSQCWYTAAAGERDGSFLWFLRCVETVDPAAAARIRALGPLNRSNAAAIADILAGLAPSNSPAAQLFWLQQRFLTVSKVSPDTPGRLQTVDKLYAMSF